MQQIVKLTKGKQLQSKNELQHLGKCLHLWVRKRAAPGWGGAGSVSGAAEEVVTVREAREGAPGLDD